MGQKFFVACRLELRFDLKLEWQKQLVLTDKWEQDSVPCIMKVFVKGVCWAWGWDQKQRLQLWMQEQINEHEENSKISSELMTA